MAMSDSFIWQFLNPYLFCNKVKFPVTKSKLSLEILKGNPWPQSPSYKQRQSPFGSHLYFPWAL